MYSHGSKKQIIRRAVSDDDARLEGLDPVIQRIFLGRGITRNEQLQRSLSGLPSPWLLEGMDEMVSHLIDALQHQRKITVVADFDADGATSCAVAIRGLKLLGLQQVDFTVPNRFEYGYGLTPEIVELVKQQSPDYIITVDNGISSLQGVDAANAANIKVLVTDHHLPGEQLPNAAAIVNPNIPDQNFPSRNIAGVGVIFYVLLALRARLRECNWFSEQGVSEPNLGQLLDFVALGTVADVVALDQTNRILVHQGLQRIRSGKCHPGIQALINVANRKSEMLTPSDLGFAIGPRLNAVGRMDDMTLGIQCLLSDDPAFASDAAEQMDQLNQDRKDIEGQMKKEALQLLSEIKAFDEKHLPAGVCLYNKDWHQGIIGILASRIKDRLHRPVIAFAPADNGEIKGSARSIDGIHIRDVLSEVAAGHPGLLTKFGGHAMAAGLSLNMRNYPPFALAFEQIMTEKLAAIDLEQKVLSDGELEQTQFSLTFAELLQRSGTWGQSFPEPLFDGEFEVIQCRIIGGQHLKFVLRGANSPLLLDAVAFFPEQAERWLGCRRILCAYKLDVNEYRGERNLQLMLQYFEKLE